LANSHKSFVFYDKGYWHNCMLKGNPQLKTRGHMYCNHWYELAYCRL